MPKIIAALPVTIAICLAAVMGLATGSQPLEPPLFNIGRADYQTALTKWNSLHVARYEETVRLANGGIWQEWKAVLEVFPTGGSTAECITDFKYLGDNIPVVGGRPVTLRVLEPNSLGDKRQDLHVPDLIYQLHQFLEPT